MDNISFRDKFIEYIKNDDVLDKDEIESLKNMAKNPKVKDHQLAENIIKDLDKFGEITNLNYTLMEGARKYDLKFVFSPNYSEKNKILGNKYEVVANIAQGDNLRETDDDSFRCGAGSLLNAFILLDGDFSKLAHSYGVETELTYKNTHLLQEKIYDFVKETDGDGLHSSYSFSYDLRGKISNIVPKGEIFNATKSIGLNLQVLIGAYRETINKKSEAVNKFLTENPNGVLQVGVHMDTKTGQISNPEKEGQNHFVVIFKKDEKFFVADTGQLENGAGKNVRELSQNEFENLTNNTTGTIHGLTMQK